MSKTNEHLYLIAQRVPPGDKWQLEGDSTIYTGISDTLEAYYRKATIKPKAYRLEPLQGKIYIITDQELENTKTQQPKQSIYGDYTL